MLDEAQMPCLPTLPMVVTVPCTMPCIHGVANVNYYLRHSFHLLIFVLVEQTEWLALIFAMTNELYWLMGKVWRLIISSPPCLLTYCYV